MRFGSLFSGIGGIDLGLERAGMTCAWQVEIDPYARAVLAKHWPNVRRFDDVRSFPPALSVAPDADLVDLIAGGFPCQDISQAGTKEGLDGERSGLWFEFERIIRVLRPRYVLVENVRALTVRGLDRVLGDLAELGFDAEWARLSAADLGAPHLRQRIFIVAARRPVPDAFSDVLRFERERFGEQRGEPRETKPRSDGEAVADPSGFGLQRGPASTGRQAREATQGHSLADSDRAGRQPRHERGRVLGEQAGLTEPRRCRSGTLPKWPPAPDDVHAWGRVPAEAQPALCGLADGLPHEMGRARRAALKGFGNACVPEKAEIIGRRLMALEATR